MTYDVEGFGEKTTFDAGTSMVVSGDSVAIDSKLLDIVTPQSGERSIVITMNMGASAVVDELLDRGATQDQLGLIDCTSRDEQVEGVPVQQLSSPGDLTGISLEFAKLLDRGNESQPVRVGFESVSTGLMYTELQTMFRFLHVFTARIRSGDMLGVFSIDPGMHEAQDYNTIRAVFDCEAAISGGETELQGTGYVQ